MLVVNVVVIHFPNHGQVIMQGLIVIVKVILGMFVVCVVMAEKQM